MKGVSGLSLYPSIANGKKLICEFNNIKTSLGMIKLLRPIDSVKDRFKLRNSLFND